MLRITIQTDAIGTTIELEGRLTGPWVEELKDCWEGARKGEREVSVSLKAVTFIDGAGKTVLMLMHRHGVKGRWMHDESHRRGDHKRRKLMSAHIEAVNDGNFQVAVLESKQPVLVDFWAPWCGPCRALGPIMESVSKEYSEVARVAKLNVDDNPVVTARYGIRAIPTLIVFTDGEEKERLIGAVSQGEIKRILDKHLEAPLN